MMDFISRELPSQPEEILIEPAKGWFDLDLRDLWRYRELLYFLTWRDIKVRYKQTVLGAAWAVLQPLLTMLVFSVIFGYLARLPSDGIPYPVFTYTALLPWQLFAYALNQSSTSLVNDQNLITKIYFPRLVIPISSVIAGVVDVAIAFLVMIGLMLLYRIPLTTRILTLPLLVAFAVVTALGVGFWLSALNVKYRDVRYALTFLAQMWFYATPIAYSSTMIPEQWRLIYGLNPMTGVVEGFRWALLGKENSVGWMILVSGIVVVILFIGGLAYFKRMEDNFADII
jgi:lipopolysaccharide transport system permease protein